MWSCRSLHGRRYQLFRWVGHLIHDKVCRQINEGGPWPPSPAGMVSSSDSICNSLGFSRGRAKGEFGMGVEEGDGI
jgi:hypothetical protein